MLCNHPAVTLPEPIRLREFDAREEKELSEFQGEMVQLAACLKGDHNKPNYPHTLVQQMNVAQAAQYCNQAFALFLQESNKAIQNGVHEDAIVVIQNTQQQDIHMNHESFFYKLFSCLPCINHH